jgi:hypothetical protein
MMSLTIRGKIRWLRIAYWTGAVLDTLAFVQMMFPRFMAKIMKVSFPVTPEYEMAMQFGASLMLAWTALLLWADRKPMERRGVLLLTMIIMVMNFITFLQSAALGLIPVSSLVPQLVMILVVLLLYLFAWIVTKNLNKT